jgi:hypothetical protein
MEFWAKHWPDLAGVSFSTTKEHKNMKEILTVLLFLLTYLGFGNQIPLSLRPLFIKTKRLRLFWEVLPEEQRT